MLHRPHVWTTDEIVALAADERPFSWFYGLARNPDNGKVELGEILPGYGYGQPFHPWADLWRIFRDLFFYQRQWDQGEELVRKVALVRTGQREEREEDARRAEIGKTCTHPNLERAGDIGSWCPDCWEWEPEFPSS